MIWTILKIALFLAAVAGLTLGVQTLMQQEAGLRVAFNSVEFTLGPVQMAIAAILLLAGLWLLMKLMGLLVASIRFINGDETAISRYFARNRRQRGLEALTDGFLALAAGEGDKALTKARKAEKLLDDQALTTLLVAQSAQAKGNTQLAEEYYKRLLEDNRGRFVGVQGLLRQQIDAGDATKARKLAETALSLRPGHAPTQDMLLGLQTKAGDWAGARKTLLETTRAGRLPKPVFQRRDAVLTLQQAEAEATNPALAQDLSIEANKRSPDLVPAAVMAARALVARGKRNAAAKVLKRSWKTRPHPDLAQAFAAIQPDETTAARVKRFDALLALHPGPEERQTRAELLIAAEDFPAARRAIGDLHETAPTQRVMTIMAAIERGEGSPDQVVRGWLARALTAPRGPQWVCDNCHHVHAHWHPLCDNCGGFDTLAWNAPPDSSGASATGTEMLPLIVGALPAADDLDDATADLDDDDADPIDATAEEIDPAPAAERADAPTATADRAPEPPPVPEDEPEGIDLDQARRMGL
ncbi:MAG: heme biosynthesis protein HemY [Rhodobacter sp.]|uniref:heme biosynthesis protein HemY n=1 Tax=Pararhodobacter sp. TaxID=2127056 RepID=UPI001D93DECE|nr:heme biosynthesis HemY N-terminal domain-containing protein [Pararhodobacter sp.]MCB1346153.1 heme biosynthesis protein HemY [Paracoccaceae bacterium]MCC0071832.1 heme biosynthesis protein HemY [Rhodobacter sp.]HPD91538.1 heme biosynthesis HemY N-terminal domain-containing protein [Pararhodobacter sp.]